MVFFANDFIVSKVLRQEKGYGAKKTRGIFQQAVDRLTKMAPSKAWQWVEADG